jgi:diacylglycerol kinase
MKPEKSGALKSRIASFGFAFSGLAAIFRQEPNARIHAVATILVVIAGFIRHLNPGQWTALCVAIVLVWVSEIFNTCIEMLCDLYCNNQYNTKVKIIKDMAAGAVLLAAIASVTIGVIVFFF